MKKLVIVESPSKSKTIEKYLGSDYKVVSSKGHIRDLSKSLFRQRKKALKYIWQVTLTVKEKLLHGI